MTDPLTQAQRDELDVDLAEATVNEILGPTELLAEKVNDG